MNETSSARGRLGCWVLLFAGYLMWVGAYLVFAVLWSDGMTLYERVREMAYIWWEHVRDDRQL